MSMEARMRAYKVMCSDPLLFLQQHFNITPDSDVALITNIFTTFGAATGVGDAATAEAVKKFVTLSAVPSFVLQAASAEKQDLFIAA